MILPLQTSWLHKNRVTWGAWSPERIHVFVICCNDRCWRERVGWAKSAATHKLSLNSTTGCCNLSLRTFTEDRAACPTLLALKRPLSFSSQSTLPTPRGLKATGTALKTRATEWGAVHAHILIGDGSKWMAELFLLVFWYKFSPFQGVVRLLDPQTKNQPM